MCGDNIDHPIEVAFSETCRDLPAQHMFRSLIMGFWSEHRDSTVLEGRKQVTRESIILPGQHSPSGETARHLENVLLRIAAMHSEGVEFHQLPRVILVWLFFWRPLHVRAAIKIP